MMKNPSVLILFLTATLLATAQPYASAAPSDVIEPTIKMYWAQNHSVAFTDDTSFEFSTKNTTSINLANPKTVKSVKNDSPQWMPKHLTAPA